MNVVAEVRCQCQNPVYEDDVKTGVHWACGFPLSGGPFVLGSDIPQDKKRADREYNWGRVYCSTCYEQAQHVTRWVYRCPNGHTSEHPWVRGES